MKKLLLIITGLIFAVLCSSFQNAENKTEGLLCNKQWVTNAPDDIDAKILLVFKADNTYEHCYVLKDASTSYTGKWSIGKDKKIYIKFDNSKVDVYEILILSKSELKIKTISSGLKKFALNN